MRHIELQKKTMKHMAQHKKTSKQIWEGRQAFDCNSCAKIPGLEQVKI